MTRTLFRALSVLALAPVAWSADAPTFAKDVAPIFARSCIGCHAANVKMGSLDLDTVEGMIRGGNKGSVLVPGKSEESRVYLMVAGKEEPAMPLSGQALTAGEIDVIKRWIDAGARPPAPSELTSVSQLSAKQTQPLKAKPGVKPLIAALAWRPDGKMLAAGTYQQVRLYEAGSDKPVAALEGHAEVVRAVAFSPDGKLLAAAGGAPGRKGELKIWDVNSRSAVKTIAAHADCIYTVAFSPDGKTIATASYDKLIKIWDVSSGAEIRTLKDHIDAIYSLTFLPNGRIVSAAADRTVKIWNPATGERLFTLSEPADGLNAVSADASGKRVAAGGLDKTLRVWTLDEKSGTLENTMIAHEDAILALAWSPDGTMLVTSASDRTIKVFRSIDLAEIKTLSKQPDWVLSLRFSPDGKTLAAGRFDGSLALIPAQDLAPAASLKIAQRER